VAPPNAGPARPAPSSPAARFEVLLQRHWWRPRASALAIALLPLAALYALVTGLQRLSYARGWRRAERAPVPVVVVGNLIAGGAGKTPVTIALVQALQAAGRRPGIVSRGYGRDTGSAVLAVGLGSRAESVGDEPLLMARRTGVPVFVGRQRVAAARALCAAHPEVDLLLCDDGLQHLALAREAEVVVFDDRGAGNGLPLPAGPMRQPLPRQMPARWQLLYSGSRVSTALPGPLATRRSDRAQPLAAWWAGDAAAAVGLATLRGRRLHALAGIAAPAPFFTLLTAAGLDIVPLPQPDHQRYASLPWPAGASDVITTEKDAVKLRPEAVGAVRVWVVRLDLELPAGFTADLLRRLDTAQRRC
jgi:tetraacyldisaccharide 4'-kinase